MCNMCFLPSTGISARIFAKWLELSTLNEINDLIETGFVQTTTRRTISLHPMIQEITLSETKPSVSSCHTLLDSLQHICLMHGMEVDYYKKLFQTIGNIIELIEKDDMPKYLLFLENAFPYMDNYNYYKGMNGIIQELTGLLKTKNIGTDSDRALLLDFQATLETKPEKSNKTGKGCTCPDRKYHCRQCSPCFQPSCQSRWTLSYERSSRSCKRTHGKKYLTA